MSLKKPYAINRRHFLRGASGFALSMPFLTSFASSEAEAQVAMEATNFIGLKSGNGVPRINWWPSQAATAVLGPNVKELQLSSIAGNISPIFGPEWNAYKNKMLMVR